MRRVDEVLDAVDLAIARSRGVVSDERRIQLLDRMRDLRIRRGYLGETVLLALAGGTGSGKSSLLNAIAGDSIASVSHLRPHTDRPLAWIPQNPDPGVIEMLLDLGVTEMHEQSVMPELAIIDLPDMDSVEEWHRRTVEELLPRVDLVMWVFDPEKYRDRVIHEEFLEPLVEFRDQFVFGLNKIDMVSPADLDDIRADLIAALEHDGFRRPEVFAFSANPIDHPPRDVGRVTEFLAEQLDTKRVTLSKMVADAKLVLRSLAEEPQMWDGPSIDFVSRWDRARTTSAQELLPGSGPAAREDALCRIEDLVAAISVEVGPACGADLRSRLDRETIEITIDLAGSAAVERSPARRGKRVKLTTQRQSAEAAASILEQRVGSEIREVLWRRARLGATITYAAVGATEVSSHL